MPREIHKQHRARDDLLDIWLYTAERWGADQADRYLDQLNQAFARLSENPSLGADLGHPRIGYRRFSVEKHRIFYTASRDRIEVIRVLLTSRDVDAQLDE